MKESSTTVSLRIEKSELALIDRIAQARRVSRNALLLEAFRFALTYAPELRFFATLTLQEHNGGKDDRPS